MELADKKASASRDGKHIVAKVAQS